MSNFQTVIHEVMKAQKRNSAGPTVAEYRDQIRENLITTSKCLLFVLLLSCFGLNASQKAKLHVHQRNGLAMVQSHSKDGKSLIRIKPNITPHTLHRTIV